MKRVNFIGECIKYIGGKYISELSKPRNMDKISNITDVVPKSILRRVMEYRENPPVIPVVIGGKEYIREMRNQLCPYDYESRVCSYSVADKGLVRRAIEVSMLGRERMRLMDNRERIGIFERAAQLMSSRYAVDILSSTMYGQGKTFYQADIDGLCELVDFLRFDNYYYNGLYKQDWERLGSEYNMSEWNPLNGFVAAISPFNFTAIGAHLCSAPALMGNGVIWKPSDYSVLSNYVYYSCLLEAGLPPEVVSFVPCDSVMFMDMVVNSSDLGGIAFTGSSQVFRDIYQSVGDAVNDYKSYPRLVGETGGNNFHFLFPDCDIGDAVMKSVLGAFEYSGQKCSATGRLYVPRSLYDDFVREIVNVLDQLKVGSVEDDYIFTSAVIHEGSFRRLEERIRKCVSNVEEYRVLYGGYTNKQLGYYVMPTVVECMDPCCDLMVEENFGPILGVYVYDDGSIDDVESAVKLCASTGGYALTGSIFTEDMDNVRLCYNYMAEVTGNFYINDKCTGSVVGKQPFGGGKLSGTNDKAGSVDFLKRFGNCRVIKVV